MSLIEVEGLNYSYKGKYQTTEALKDVTCSFDRGKFYAIVGPSGSGKTTLLSLLAGLDLPSGGRIMVDGRDMAETDRDAYRRDRACVVYQSFNLLELLSALENVMLPMELQKKPRREAEENAKRLLAEVGLPESVYKKRPVMMSGGEQQRVAIARALAAEGEILLADEPTGNLDSENGEIIAGLLERLAHEKNYAVIMITHNDDMAKRADHVYCMRDGRLFSAPAHKEETS